MYNRPINRELILKIWKEMGQPSPTDDVHDDLNNIYLPIRQKTGYGLYTISQTIKYHEQYEHRH